MVTALVDEVSAGAICDAGGIEPADRDDPASPTMEARAAQRRREERMDVDPKPLEILVCHDQRSAERAAQELVSDEAGLAYPVRDGIRHAGGRGAHRAMASAPPRAIRRRAATKSDEVSGAAAGRGGSYRALVVEIRPRPPRKRWNRFR